MAHWGKCYGGTRRGDIGSPGPWGTMKSGLLTSLAFHGHGGRIPPLLGGLRCSTVSFERLDCGQLGCVTDWSSIGAERTALSLSRSRNFPAAWLMERPTRRLSPMPRPSAQDGWKLRQRSVVRSPNPRASAISSRHDSRATYHLSVCRLQWRGQNHLCAGLPDYGLLQDTAALSQCR
jgi:hypothetical protein